MNYQETLDWLFTQLPMYQRLGKAAYKPDLSNTHFLMDLLDNPEKKFKSIHVAGTNGKGSVSHMLAAIFQKAGYKTGLYTSPHLKDFRERIRINGSMIPKEEVTDFISKFKTDFSSKSLSFFEMTVGLAFHYFSKKEVDIAIVETGMGGRLDSTNVLNPELSVITNIGLDHQAFLGDSLDKIAGEKAGIIKENTPIIIGEKHPETIKIFEEKAKEKSAPLIFAEESPERIPMSDLKGNYQEKNIQTILCAVKQLSKKYSLKQHLSALKEVSSLTGLRGRWEILNHSPLIVCDTGHNYEAMQYIVSQIVEQNFEDLHIVLGMVSDKNSQTILSILPKNAQYYFCRPNIPRGRSAEELRDEAIQYGLTGEYYPSPCFALTQAKQNAKKDDMIFVGGSTFVVADIL